MLSSTGMNATVQTLSREFRPDAGPRRRQFHGRIGESCLPWQSLPGPRIESWTISIWSPACGPATTARSRSSILRYQPRIAAYVGGMVRDHGRAEDITQEVFLSALRRLRDGDERQILFRPWIYEIAKNKCIDAYRRGRHTTEVSFDADDQVGAADHGRLAEPGTTPDAVVEGKLAFDNLRGAFGGLSPVASRHPRDARVRGALLPRDRRAPRHEPTRRREHAVPRPQAPGRGVR